MLSSILKMIKEVVFFALFSALTCEQRIHKRIIGGSPSVPRQWSSVASLQHHNGFHFCGGVLLSTKWVLTAAHCIEGLSIKSFRVAMGEYSLSVMEGTEQYRNLSSIHINPFYNITHPDFNFYLPNDLALLELSQPVVITPAVDTSALPTPCHSFTGQTCVAIGWGKTTAGSYSADRMQQSNMNVIDTTLCRATWGDDVYYDSLCVFTYGTTTCEGDSGGPLMCKDHSQYIIAGISSWGDLNCGDHPSIYTKVSQHISWIHDIMK